MVERYDLSQCEWKLSGWTPWLWKLIRSLETGDAAAAEILPVPAKVPGSVQAALRCSGLLPDWNLPDASRECEWVEHRHWIFETSLPNEWFLSNRKLTLHCNGLDYSGWIYLDGIEIGAFVGTHIPFTFELSGVQSDTLHLLQIVFDLPPRWLGQFGYTSNVREYKARFNYSWDWVPRIVQIGIWDDIFIESSDGASINEIVCRTDLEVETGLGSLSLNGRVTGPSNVRVRMSLLSENGHILRRDLIATGSLYSGIIWSDLMVSAWQPNGRGDHALYTVQVDLLDADGVVLDVWQHRVGFRHIEWRSCDDAPEGADPWICVVNGEPLFLQGVNCPPMLPNFADTTEETYRSRLELYQALGLNILRINGCGFLEKQIFYDICDELGLFVWQDAPLSSSGIDNVPPDDEASIASLRDILKSYIDRRGHHACLLLWCGGNELYDRAPEGYGVPMTTEHPLIRAMADVVMKHDPGRRFVTTTATGPRFYADPKDFGKGLHWNTHGPWKLDGTMADWEAYWNADDSLFRAESGAPGACDADIIRQYAGSFDPLPVSPSNPVWRRPLTWWIEIDAFIKEHHRDPISLEEYVDWSQQRQAEALRIAVSACKTRFPKCGGMIIWCGHDCYPCSSNTSLIDFHNRPKLAALAVSKVWLRSAGGNET